LAGSVSTRRARKLPVSEALVGREDVVPEQKLRDAQVLRTPERDAGSCAGSRPLERPSNQQKLLDILARATDTSVRDVPGFISAELHRSVDGTKVTMHSRMYEVVKVFAGPSKPTH